jgi:hypothetical protein
VVWKISDGLHNPRIQIDETDKLPKELRNVEHDAMLAVLGRCMVSVKGWEFARFPSPLVSQRISEIYLPRYGKVVIVPDVGNHELHRVVETGVVELRPVEGYVRDRVRSISRADLAKLKSLDVSSVRGLRSEPLIGRAR